jgi:hypothetical protein
MRCVLPTPLFPTISRLSLRRMKSPVTSNSHVINMKDCDSLRDRLDK